LFALSTSIAECVAIKYFDCWMFGVSISIAECVGLSTSIAELFALGVLFLGLLIWVLFFLDCWFEYFFFGILIRSTFFWDFDLSTLVVVWIWIWVLTFEYLRFVCLVIFLITICLFGVLTLMMVLVFVGRSTYFD